MSGSVAGRTVPAIGTAVVFSTGITQRNQGLTESDRPVIAPRHLARLMLTHPDWLKDQDTELVKAVLALE
ncbi:hypothetical protein AB0I02_37220 [Streptomyces phaeochromogenes]